jgi:hypothetical protein
MTWFPDTTPRDLFLPLLARRRPSSKCTMRS